MLEPEPHAPQLGGEYEFKILLLGSDAVGKTTFLKRHLVGVFDPKYNRTLHSLTRLHSTVSTCLATPQVEVTPLKLKTTRGNVTLKVWENGSQPGGLSLGEAS